ncbi:MAG: hypothetical protein QXX68_02020 [Candidatus Pacearchaeota archaeon]
MGKKKAQLQSDPIIIFIVVILVVLLVAFFLFRTRIDLWIKNLPEYQRNDGEDIEIVPDNIQVDICPDGYEEVGRFKSGTSNSFFYIKESGNYKRTEIQWVVGGDKIIINLPLPFREVYLGSNILNGPHERKIYIDNSVFTRGSSKFLEVLKKELETGEELFKALILLDNSTIKGLGGPNYVCQKKEAWDDLERKLNLIYWGVEEPRIVDLRGETRRRILEKKEEYLIINLKDYLVFGLLRNNVDKFYLKKENDRIFLYFGQLTTARGRRLSSVGEISEDGRIIIYCTIEGKSWITGIYSNYIKPEELKMPDNILKDISGKPYGCKTNIFLNYSEINNTFLGKRSP